MRNGMHIRELNSKMIIISQEALQRSGLWIGAVVRWQYLNLVNSYVGVMSMMTYSHTPWVRMGKPQPAKPEDTMLVQLPVW